MHVSDLHGVCSCTQETGNQGSAAAVNRSGEASSGYFVAGTADSVQLAQPIGGERMNEGLFIKAWRGRVGTRGGASVEN